MEVVDDILHRLAPRSRRSSESENAKVLVSAHHVAHDTAVGVVSTRSVRLIHDEAGDVARVDPSFGEVVLERLRGAVDDSLGRPADVTKLGSGVAGELDAVLLRDAGDVVAGGDLLSDERARRGEEDDLALGEPAVVVEPVGERKRCKWEARPSSSELHCTHMTTAAMNVLPSPVGSETRVFSKRATWTMLYW